MYAKIKLDSKVNRAAHLNHNNAAAGAIVLPIAGFGSTGIFGVLGIWKSKNTTIDLSTWFQTKHEAI